MRTTLSPKYIHKNCDFQCFKWSEWRIWIKWEIIKYRKMSFVKMAHVRDIKLLIPDLDRGVSWLILCGREVNTEWYITDPFLHSLWDRLIYYYCPLLLFSKGSAAQRTLYHCSDGRLLFSLPKSNPVVQKWNPKAFFWRFLIWC